MTKNFDSEAAVNDSRITPCVETLLGAYNTGTPIPPLTQTHPALGLEEAYAIQMAQVETWQRGGRVLKGHKVGLTSAAIQKQLGVSEPDYGHLFADTFYMDSEPIRADTFIQPRIEPEIAFVLKKPLQGPGVTVAEAIAAVDFAVASLEIIDSRIANWKITLPDTIADNASSGGVVLGSRPVRLDDLDLRLTGIVLYRNGQIAGTGAGGAVMGSPINALTWLANTVGRLGVGLEAGSVILPGALTAAIDVRPGDTISANFAGLGSVTASFAPPSSN
ncbi:2-keto-4-pentenoate hydratase [Arthrobacter sp. NPDC089319]|uniref:2-keto-4-pentenoate hydratase n=1 Tax=Arthrobacter sp. NPDC089319 TaxID=3155915 RepID=UPI0034395209